MSQPMILALLSGAKTQTRRAVKLPLIDRQFTGWAVAGCEANSLLREGHHELCPYGKVSDHLWVKETFAPHPEVNAETIYRADRGGDYQGAAQGDFKWKPSLFMPRARSRITLEITEIRVERLQDISDGDAKLEGCIVCEDRSHSHAEHGLRYTPYRTAYQALWESIHGKGAWDVNPWLWVIGFKKL